jgi:zinc and cadmium transporter
VTDIPVLLWIVAGGVLMTLIAMVGSVTLLLEERTLKLLLLPLVALAAGSLIGGAFFHMLPAAVAAAPAASGSAGIWLSAVLGFATFMALEQLLHWHHGHRAAANGRRPFTYLILVGDTLHNFIGGLAIAGTFLIDVRLGVTAWLAAAAHEIPQELGDFSVLVHGGWSTRRALLFNALSGATFLVGGLTTYALSPLVDVTFLIPFAAGNFIYIGAADLVPEIMERSTAKGALTNLSMFLLGVALMYAAALLG